MNPNTIRNAKISFFYIFFIYSGAKGENFHNIKMDYLPYITFASALLTRKATVAHADSKLKLFFKNLSLMVNDELIDYEIKKTDFMNLSTDV